EGAGAVGVAALLTGKAGGSGMAVPILSGGNIDATMLISVMRHGLTSAGRYLVVRTQLSDRPGSLIKLLSLVAEERGNVISVEHRACVDARGDEQARRDRCACPALADRHDRLARVEPVRAGLAQQAVRDVQRAGDVALVALRLLAHVEHLDRPLLEQALELVEV